MRPRPLAVAAVVAPLLLGPPAVVAQSTPDAASPTEAASPWAEAVGATPGLAAWWRLGEREGVVADDRAGDHDGTYAAGVRLGAPGLVAGDADTAVSLDAGGEAFVDVGDALDFPGLTPFTVEAWIAPGAFQSPYPRILQKDGVDANGNRQGYLVYLNQQTGNLGFERWRDGRADVVTTAEPIALDRASHVAATFDGSTMRLYVDGAQVAEAPAVQDLADNPFGLRLGARSDGESPFFGTLDEVAVYEAALDAETVAAHFAAGAGAGNGAAAGTGGAAPAASPAADEPADIPVGEPSEPATSSPAAAQPAATAPADQTIIGPPAPSPTAGAAPATDEGTPAAPAVATAEPAIATVAPPVATAVPAAETPAAVATAAAPTPTPEPIAATTTDEVNFRAGPSTDTVIIATLPAGTAVEATGKVVDGFVQVVVDGRRGWIFADFLTYP